VIFGLCPFIFSRFTAEPRRLPLLLRQKLEKRSSLFCGSGRDEKKVLKYFHLWGRVFRFWDQTRMLGLSLRLKIKVLN